MRRTPVVLAMVVSMLLAGCFGDGSGTVSTEETVPVFDTYERIDAQPHDVEPMFYSVVLRTNATTNTSWAVLDAS